MVLSSFPQTEERKEVQRWKETRINRTREVLLTNNFICFSIKLYRRQKTILHVSQLKKILQITKRPSHFKFVGTKSNYCAVALKLSDGYITITLHMWLNEQLSWEAASFYFLRNLSMKHRNRWTVLSNFYQTISRDFLYTASIDCQANKWWE